MAIKKNQKKNIQPTWFSITNKPAEKNQQVVVNQITSRQFEKNLVNSLRCSSCVKSIIEEMVVANNTDCAEVITCINEQLALPWAWLLTNFNEAVQDAVGEAFEWFDYSDSINSWIQENPLTTATSISYDNTIVNLLTSTTVQWAIDELATNATQREAIWSASVSISGSTITLPNTPLSDAQLRLHRNGLRLEPVEDYTMAGNIITLVLAPFPNDKFYITYQY